MAGLFGWAASLPAVGDLSDAAGLWPVPMACAVLGLAFGACFWLLGRRASITARWPQRAIVGAVLGLVLMLIAGTLVHVFLTGWGGPGGGGFRRPSIAAASVLFAWLIPALAVAGVATPRAALIEGATPS
jgi:hypothetical protein